MLHESPPQALGRLIGKNPRRYGGYIVHIGVVLIFFGVAGALFTIEKQITVSAEQSFEVGRYTLLYTGITEREDAHIAAQIATVNILVDGQQIDTMHPEKRFYKKQNQPTTEVDIRPTLGGGPLSGSRSYDEPSGLATFQVFINPLVSWIWIGGLILILGTCVIMAPNPAERQAFALARTSAGHTGQAVVE